MRKIINRSFVRGYIRRVAGYRAGYRRLTPKEDKKKEFVRNAFKSEAVCINGHSMEFIGKGVLDVRILHRFGELNSGAKNLFGLDEANMRLCFDYGLTNNLTIESRP